MEKLKAGLAALLLAASAASAATQGLVPAERVRTSGRMAVAGAADGGWRATWPGVNWALRFEGTAVGVRLDDAVNFWVLELDGQPALQIAPTPGPHIVWLRGLPPGEHLARLVKRTESPGSAAQVLGFELEDGGRALTPPIAPARRIEFIGDSYTAAMGNLSPGRDCSGAEISARTDITQGFGVLTARALGAEWRIHAKSGAGLVRNWDGGLPEQNFGTHYARLLQTDPSLRPADDWRPQIVVIGLGTNDFSTAVKPGEPRAAAQLQADFLQAYRALLADLRQRYGDPQIVLLSLPLGQGDRLRPLVQQLLAEQRAAGHTRIHGLDWGTLRGQGCGSHPDAHDHRQMSEMLLATLQSLEP